MAEKDDTSKGAVVLSVGAAAYALGRYRQASASQIVGLDQATMNLLIAIAQSSDHIDSKTLEALSKLQEIIDKIGVGGGTGGQGWPPNADGTRTLAVACPVVGVAVQAPDMLIPDGMALAIKAHPLNAAASLVFVARTIAECTNPNSSWPLVPNEPIHYFVKNANVFYVSTNIAGSIAMFTAEQRS